MEHIEPKGVVCFPGKQGNPWALLQESKADSSCNELTDIEWEANKDEARDRNVVLRSVTREEMDQSSPSDEAEPVMINGTGHDPVGSYPGSSRGN